MRFFGEFLLSVLIPVYATVTWPLNVHKVQQTQQRRVGFHSINLLTTFSFWFRQYDQAKEVTLIKFFRALACTFGDIQTSMR